MENTSYRKLDVDAYDPEKFEDNDEGETPAGGPDERQISQLLQSMRLQDALKVALANPPVKTKNQVIISNHRSWTVCFQGTLEDY